MKHKDSVYRVFAFCVISVLFTVLVGPLSGQKTSAQDGANQLYLPLTAYRLAPVIPSTTVPIDDATLDALVDVSSDGVYTFEEITPVLETLDPGDIMVADVSAAVPYGFLRRVQSVTQQNGQISVQTEQAALTDAIQQGDIALTRLLTPNMVQDVRLAPGVTAPQLLSSPTTEFYFEIEDLVVYDADGDESTTGDQLRANGSVTLQPELHFSVVIRNSAIDSLTFTNRMIETTELELFSSIEIPPLQRRIEIARLTLSPVTVMVGTVPVVMFPVLPVYVGTDGSVSVGLTANATQAGDFLAGVRYMNGQWQGIGDSSIAYTHTDPTVITRMEFKAYAGPRLALLLYGIAGPYADTRGYLELNADPSQTPWWELWAGLEVSSGVVMDLIGYTIESPDLTVIGVRELLASAPASTCAIFQDDFSDPGSGWYTTYSNNYDFEYDNGEFRMFLKEPIGTSTFNSNIENRTGDLEASVNIRREGNVGHAYGLQLMTNFSPTHMEQYTILIEPALQQYRVEGFSVDGGPSIIIADTLSSAIRPGRLTNHLLLRKVGPQVTIFINGTEVNSFNVVHVDDAYAIRLAVDAFPDYPDAASRFDDFCLN